MRARVIQYEKGKKPKIIKTTNSVIEAKKIANDKSRSVRIRTKVQRGLGWRVEKLVNKKWIGTSTFYG